MRTLVVGVGALGGVIAARLLDAGLPVSLATRDAASARALLVTGLQVSGVGGTAVVPAPAEVAPLEAYDTGRPFDLVILATKAQDAIAVAPRVVRLLTDTGILLPVQNGGVSQMLDERIPGGRILGGLSNLGTTMVSLGIYEQRNAGHLLVGELSGGDTGRAEQVRRWLERGIEVRLSANMAGAIWSKLLLNCSVTTLGAISGLTMREYLAAPQGVEMFVRAYDETLSVASAVGIRPERMLVEPVPPGWSGRSVQDRAYQAWLDEIVQAYGNLKPSMLQDFERGRTTEIDFINGYVADCGATRGVATPVNAAIVETVRAITRGDAAPHPRLLGETLARAHAVR